MTGPHNVDVFRDPDASCDPWVAECMECEWLTGDWESESQAAVSADWHYTETMGAGA